jgi:hypothetical protein
MSVTNDEAFCVKHNSDEYIWYTPSTSTYQCDACWDDQLEIMFGMERQYDTPRG